MRRGSEPRLGKWIAALLLPLVCGAVLLDFHVLVEAQGVHRDPFAEPLQTERVVSASCGVGLAPHLDQAANVVERPCPACLVRTAERWLGSPLDPCDRPLCSGPLAASPEPGAHPRTVDLRESRGPPRA